jgi:fatty acid CoA ligase FadD9
VFPSTLEAIYETSPLIGQIFVTFSQQQPSSEKVLAAVVVPGPGLVSQQQHQLLSLSAQEELIRKELERLRFLSGLQEVEVPKKIILESNPWTQGNGMLTAQHKKNRPLLHQKYREI